MDASPPSRALDRVAAGGLLLSAAFGLAGTFVTSPLLPTSAPLPFFAYPFLVANLLGWAWTLCRTH